jgi:acetylornithine deacetylase
MAARRAEIDAILARLAGADPRFESRVLTHINREPFESDPQSAVVQTLGACVQDITGHESQLVGENAWMDAALIQAAGIPTVVFGPRGGGFHGPVEWVETDQVIAAARILAETVARFCA